MSKSFLIVAFAALVAAGLLAPSAHAQHKPRPGARAGKPSVWSSKPVGPAPSPLPLQAPKLPNNWQPELKPPVFGQSSSKRPKGAHPGYRQAPDSQPLPAAKKPPIKNQAPLTTQRPTPSTPGTNPIQTQVIQSVQPARPPINLSHDRPHGPRNPNNVTVKPNPEGPVKAPGNRGPRNPPVAGGSPSGHPPHPNRYQPLDFNFPPPVAPPVRHTTGNGGKNSGGTKILLPTFRPVRPIADPSPQPSRPAEMTTASAEQPVRVRVRSGSGRPRSSPLPAAGGRPRPTVVIGRDGNIQGVSASPAVEEIAGSMRALTAMESSAVAEAAERFGNTPEPPIVSAEQDELISEGLNAISSGEPLTEEQREALTGFVDLPFTDDAWDRVEDLGLEPAEVRGAAYAGLQEERRRSAVAAGQPAASVPTFSGEVSADLAFFRDALELAPPGGMLTPAQQTAAAAGLDALLQGRPMTTEQREAVTAVVNGATTAAFAAVDTLVGGTTNLRGSLGVALQLDADAQAALASAGNQTGNTMADIRTLVEGILTTIGGGGGGEGGVVMPVPAWSVGGGFATVDPGFVDISIAGGAVVSPGYVDPAVTVAGAAPAPAPSAAIESAPGLKASGTTVVDPSAPAGPAPSPQPGPGEAKYDRCYLSVRNDSSTRLAVFLQYETISSGAGDWKWYPCDPTGREAVAYSLEPGQEVALKRDDWSVNARRVRIWAATESGQVYDQFRGEDLWLVEEQPNGERYYIARETETFPLAFGEPTTEN